MESKVTVPSGRYKAGEVVWSHYWFTDDLCRVTIKGTDQGKVVVAHDVKNCLYCGAPDERIVASQIVARASADWHSGVVPEGAEEVVEPGPEELAQPTGPEDGQVGDAEQQQVQDV